MITFPFALILIIEDSTSVLCVCVNLSNSQFICVAVLTLDIVTKQLYRHLDVNLDP